MKSNLFFVTTIFYLSNAHFNLAAPTTKFEQKSVPELITYHCTLGQVITIVQEMRKSQDPRIKNVAYAALQKLKKALEENNSTTNIILDNANYRVSLSSPNDKYKKDELKYIERLINASNGIPLKDNNLQNYDHEYKISIKECVDDAFFWLNSKNTMIKNIGWGALWQLRDKLRSNETTAQIFMNGLPFSIQLGNPKDQQRIELLQLIENKIDAIRNS